MMLSLSLLALLTGPVITHQLAGHRRLTDALDGFTFTMILGLVLVVIVPESIAYGGLWTLPVMLLGAIGPSLGEKALRRKAARRLHSFTLLLAAGGIALHTILDGAAITGKALEASASLLPLAVVLHRLPVSIAVWVLVRETLGQRAAWVILGLMAAGTVAGYLGGQSILGTLDLRHLAWFQALVAGTLVHVLLHRPGHAHDHCSDGERWAEGVGSVLGIVALIWVLLGHEGERESWAPVTSAFIDLALVSAPALLFAYLLSGLISAFMPQSPVRWMGRGGSAAQALKGMAIGLPMPVCSCGVVPLYRTLVRRGAPPAAAMAFLIATPEIGLDALLLSLPLLGLDMAAARLLTAGLVALLIGWLVGRMVKPLAATELVPPPDRQPHWRQKLRRGMREGLIDSVDHTGPWILVGLAVAAVLQPLLADAGLARIAGGWDVLLLAAIGLPAYICASGATPIAAVLLLNGASAGGILAFLLTGPATNVTTFGVLSSLHGKRVALVFGVCTAAAAIGAGFAVNALFPSLGAGAREIAFHEHFGWISYLSLAALTAIYGYSLLRRGARAFVAEVWPEDAEAGHSH